MNKAVWPKIVDQYILDQYTSEIHKAKIQLTKKKLQNIIEFHWIYVFELNVDAKRTDLL